MPLLRPDPTFYPSPSDGDAVAAGEARLPGAASTPKRSGAPDAIGVVDVDPDSKSYGRLVGQTDMPHAGDELHHFGWNACSSCLCPYAPHPHMERRYLIVPGIDSSRIHVLDTKPDPRNPKIVKVIEAEELARRTGYAAPHTVHCGPDGIYLSALGAPDGNGPGGIFMLDPETFDVRGRWEIDRGPQHLAYDFWWHLGLDTMVTSDVGHAEHGEGRRQPGAAARRASTGNTLHVWDLRRRRHVQALDLGAEQQMVLELRPAHDPTRAYGFAGVVLSLKDLSSSIWLWYRERTANGSNGEWAIKKVIEIPAEPADPDKLPPLLKGFKAVAPLVTDINLSLDDRFLYVSCWGTGEFIQYDVQRSVQPEEDRARSGSAASCGARRIPASPASAERRAADGRDQPRRQARLLHQLALLALGRQFYPGRRPRLDGEGRRAARGRHGARSRVLPRVRRRCARTRCGSRAATPPPTRTATPEARARGSPWQWSAMLLLGAFHGINPGMGWLFAVALGMQERSARGVWRALPPIALGHALAVGVSRRWRPRWRRRVVPLAALQVRRRGEPCDARAVPALAAPTSRDSAACRWLSRPDALVVPDGVGARRGLHGAAVRAADAAAASWPLGGEHAGHHGRRRGRRAVDERAGRWRPHASRISL